ncbi:MAG: hypothetical protein ACJ71H_10015 [Nitrososphaeraceae archaeon]
MIAEEFIFINRYCGVSQIYWKISLHEERAIITTRIQPAPISAILVLVTASTLSLVAVSMLTIQEASAEKNAITMMMLTTITMTIVKLVLINNKNTQRIVILQLQIRTLVLFSKVIKV